MSIFLLNNEITIRFTIFGNVYAQDQVITLGNSD